MSNENDSKNYSITTIAEGLDELDKHREAIRARREKAMSGPDEDGFDTLKTWGDVHLRQFGYNIESRCLVFANNGGFYSVTLESINTAEKLRDVSFHLAGKTWFRGDVLACWFLAIYYLHSRSN